MWTQSLKTLHEPWALLMIYWWELSRASTTGIERLRVFSINTHRRDFIRSVVRIHTLQSTQSREIVGRRYLRQTAISGEHLFPVQTLFSESATQWPQQQQFIFLIRMETSLSGSGQRQRLQFPCRLLDSRSLNASDHCIINDLFA